MPNWNKVVVSGSNASLNSLTVSNGITGSLLGTASYANMALSASYAPDTTFPYTGSALITGSLGVTGSISTSGSNGTINGLFVSLGGGNVSTNISIGATTNFSSSATGTNNFAAGNAALSQNTTGNNNTAIGSSALCKNTTGLHNTAIGNSALFSNKTGNQNTAIGDFALGNNTTGCSNTAIGRALSYNTTGINNTAIGCRALRFNTTGANNFAAGSGSLQANTTGTHNTAIGNRALFSNTTGCNNIAFGQNAGCLFSGSSSNNIAIGFAAGPSTLTQESNKLYIASGSGTPLIKGDFAAKTVNISGSLIATSFTGSLLGTASFATQSTSASFATTASFYGGSVTSASYAATASNIQGGDTNYIPIWNTATSLSSSIIYQSTGNVGIGTTSPSYKLHIESGDVLVGQSVAKVSVGPQGTTGDVHFGASGLAAPSTGSQDYGFYAAHNAYRTSTGAWVHSRTSTIPAVRILGSGGVSSGNSGFSFDYSANSGTGNIAWTNLMQIQTNGNVGIGTTSPGYKLDIAGDIRLNTNATYIYNRTTGGGNVRMLGINVSNIAYIGPIDSGPIAAIFNASSTSLFAAFYTSGAERMRITSAGNVGIGTATPTAKLHVVGSTLITGSLTVTGSVIATTGFTGSLQGTASFATSASYAQTASYVENAQTASFVTGSIFTSANPALSASYAQTASFVQNAQTASFVLNAISSSFATTASYATNGIKCFICTRYNISLHWFCFNYWIFRCNRFN
jgi:trimeric autotransporter adhesin